MQKEKMTKWKTEKEEEEKKEKKAKRKKFVIYLSQATSTLNDIDLRKLKLNDFHLLFIIMKSKNERKKIHCAKRRSRVKKVRQAKIPSVRLIYFQSR